jgi:hypothetical protein
MSLLEEIGAILGFVAFGGLAVLAFLTFQQARHLRRLREWAGRQPERAAAENERLAEIAAGSSAPGTAVAPGTAEPSEERGPSRLDRIRGEMAFRWEEVNRRSPVDPRLLLGGVVAIVVAVGILTSGFGLLGSDETSEPAADTSQPAASAKIEVAVLNGTAPETGGVGVSGVAGKASDEVEKLDGFEVGEVGDAGSYSASVVMFEEGEKSAAKELASELDDVLGETDYSLITPDIQNRAAGAPLALIVGLDDQGI